MLAALFLIQYMFFSFVTFVMLILSTRKEQDITVEDLFIAFVMSVVPILNLVILWDMFV